MTLFQSTIILESVMEVTYPCDGSWSQEYSSVGARHPITNHFIAKTHPREQPTTFSTTTQQQGAGWGHCVVLCGVSHCSL